jgi:PHD/YefM family antitoxin component YafN of YafNO toxin-antitoxin module
MATSEQYVIDAAARKTGVLLSLEYYERLMEDLHDLAAVAERRDEEPISLDDLKQRLKQDGLI